MELKRKNLGVAGVKVLDAAQGIVEAFVAGIGNRDSGKDIILPGAFVDSLAKRMPKGVWSHDWMTPVSKTLDIREVPAGDPSLPAKMQAAGIGGLYVKTQFNLNTQRGRDAFADVEFFGDEQEWSIGYREVETTYDKAQDANLLHKIDLYEYSPVLFGMNPLTATASVKGADVEVDTSALPPSLARRVKAAIEVVNAADAPSAKGEDNVDPAVKFYLDVDPLPGSVEEVQEAVATALQAAYPGYYFWPVATFQASVIVHYDVWEADTGRYDEGYWSLTYDVGADGTVTLGEPAPVEFTATVTAAAKAAREALRAAHPDDERLAKHLDAKTTVTPTPTVTTSTASGLGPDDVKRAIEEALDERAADLKAGRVISRANERRLRAAADAISEVLDAVAEADDGDKAGAATDAKGEGTDEGDPEGDPAAAKGDPDPEDHHDFVTREDGERGCAICGHDRDYELHGAKGGDDPAKRLLDGIDVDAYLEELSGLAATLDI